MAIDLTVKANCANPKRIEAQLALHPDPDHKRRKETNMTEFAIQARADDANPKKRWQNALADFEAASADLDSLGNDFADVENDYYCAVRTTALHALIDTPAPDTGSIQFKLQLFEREELYNCDDTGRQLILNAFYRDIRHFQLQLLAAESQLKPEQKERAQKMLKKMLGPND